MGGGGGLDSLTVSLLYSSLIAQALDKEHSTEGVSLAGCW